jgi:hypothetical protein
MDGVKMRSLRPEEKDEHAGISGTARAVWKVEEV